MPMLFLRIYFSFIGLTYEEMMNFDPPTEEDVMES